MAGTANFKFTTTPYNPNNWGQQLGSRYGYGQELQTSFNKQFFDDYYNEGLSGLIAKKKIGIYSTTRVDSFDFGRYLGLLPDFATKQNLLDEAMTKSKSGEIFQMGQLKPIAPKVEYISEDNGDGVKKFGHLGYLSDPRQQQFRLTVDEFMVNWYNTNVAAAGTAAGTPIPTTATRIKFGPNTNFLGELKSGCIDCHPNSCGRGYRQLYFMKNQNPLVNGRPGSYYQGTTAGLPGSYVNEVAIVLDVEEDTDGGIILTLKRAANGKTLVDAQNNITFQSGAISLDVRDYILVGTVTPTTECIEPNLKCAYVQPKMYSYCNSIREHVDCIGCINKTFFKTKQASEIISRKEQLALSLVHNTKIFWQRFYNDMMVADEIYGQNYPMPNHPTVAGVGDTFNGELIPASYRGLLRQFDAYARELEITFSSCEQTCWEFTLSTLVDALEAGSEGQMFGASYNDPGWIMVGDIEGLDEMYNSRLTNFLPLSAADNQQMLNARSMTYSNTPTSLFGKANTPDKQRLNNEFYRTGSDYGIRMSALQIGKYKFRSIHDRAMALMEPGVIRLMYVPDITFFTDNQDDIMASMFGGRSPFLPSTALRGSLIPSIVSNDMQNVNLNGVNQFMAAKDCPMSWYAYIRAGIHLEAANLPKSIKIRLNSRITNPDYDPQNPTSTPTIKGTLYDLDCGCMRARKNLELQLETWANGDIVNGPIQPMNI